MRLSHSRRGIELSINFIVALILAIAVFIGGMLFMTKFFTHAEKIRGDLDAQTEKQIEKLLDSGSPVVVPISTKELFRNDFGTFGAGVLARSDGTYTLTLEQGQAFRKDKTAIPWNMAEWNIQPGTAQTKTLKKNEKGKFLIGMLVPKSADSGTYLFTVKVAYADPANSANNLAEYDNPLQIIVKVP
jgi:hypothetical protein